MTDLAQAAALPAPAADTIPSRPHLAPDAAREFSALFDSLVLQPPGRAATGPSVLKDVASAQQELLTAVATPLPDLTNVPMPQAMNLLTQKMSQVSTAHIGFGMALSTATSVKKSVESVLNQK